MSYSLEQKEVSLKKILPPNCLSVVNLSAAEGLSESTVYHLGSTSQELGSTNG